MITLYGIPNCDSVKKAIKYLSELNIEYAFFNYKKDAIPVDLLKDFISEFGFDGVFNKKSATYRQLSEEQKILLIQSQSGSNTNASEYELGIRIMQENPSIIKRPIILGCLNKQTIVLIGFDLEKYQNVFQSISPKK